MFFLFGRRYPWLSLIIGGALVGVGVATGDIRYDVTGCLALAFGVVRCALALRQRGLSGLIGHRDGGGIGGMLR